MTEDQIKHMVSRFLQWKLPADFNPDGGVSFEPVASAGTPHERRREPVGTNLLTGPQAEAMVRHMLQDLPAASSPITVTLKVDAADAIKAVNAEFARCLADVRDRAAGHLTSTRS